LTGSGAVCAQALFSPMNIAATDTISHAALVNMLRRLKPNMVASLCVREDSGKVGKEIAPSVEHLLDGHTVCQSEYTGRNFIVSVSYFTFGAMNYLARPFTVLPYPLAAR
jgi:hypothetical protein